MAKKTFWVGMLVLLLVFGMTVTGCDTGDGGGSGEQQSPTPLQQAINWANEDARRWTSVIKDPFFTDISFKDPLSNDMIRDPNTTFIQFVEDALTEAWYTTYRYNPAEWNVVKWKEIIIENTRDQTRTYFSFSELPLIIS